MTSLESRLKDVVKAAMKKGAREELEVLRMLLSDAKTVAIAAGGERSGLSDEVMLGVLRKAVKTRSEAAALYAQGGRKDLEDRENAQIEVIRRYLPAEVSEAEIEVVVDTVIVNLGATTRADMGRVMKEAMARLAGRAEGASVSRIVASRLS
jgi:uncharacterized protein YqeY